MSEITQVEFLDILKARALQLEAFLADYLNDQVRLGEDGRPKNLMKAIRHGVLNGGKRLRPFLLEETAQMLGGKKKAALYAAAGLECIHCYSLIHDDLPAMDDDDLRRGQPTVHKAYDEATAILAGDALLTLGFELTVSPENGLNDKVRSDLVFVLAKAGGLGGMVGGQMLDMENENENAGEKLVDQIHRMKTGALIRYACEAGALIGGSQADVQIMRNYGDIIGRAFQLADDLLDVTADAAIMGKATGKDANAGKSTQVATHGTEWARQRLDELVQQADALLEPYGDSAKIMRAATQFIAKRNY